MANAWTQCGDHGSCIYGKLLVLKIYCLTTMDSWCHTKQSQQIKKDKNVLRVYSSQNRKADVAVLLLNYSSRKVVKSVIGLFENCDRSKL